MLHSALHCDVILYNILVCTLCTLTKAAYWAVECLQLERNNISRIRNLQPLRQLVCLYLQNNKIERIEGLEGLPIKVASCLVEIYGDVAG